MAHDDLPVKVLVLAGSCRTGSLNQALVASAHETVVGLKKKMREGTPYWS